MTNLRLAMLSALLSPLVRDDDASEQEPGAPATGRRAVTRLASEDAVLVQES
jgi:hypothetical protein